MNISGGGDDPVMPDGPDYPVVRPYTDPTTGETFDIVDGEVLVSFRNMPMFSENVDPHAFEETPPTATPIGGPEVLGTPEIEAFIQETGITVDCELPPIATIGAVLPPGTTVEDAIQNWPQQYPNLVKAVQPNDICRPAPTIPNDTYFPQQWALREFNEKEPSYGADAWDAWSDPNGKGVEDVYVAVVGTGVCNQHPDLAARISQYRVNVRRYTPPGTSGVWYWGYWGTNSSYGVPPCSYSTESAEHETYVAGAIAATTNNLQGIAGTSWYTKLFPVACCTAIIHEPAGDRLVMDRKAELMALYEVGLAKGMFAELVVYGATIGKPLGLRYDVEAVNCSFEWPYFSLPEARFLWDLSRFMVVVAPSGNGELDGGHDISPGQPHRCYPAGLVWGPVDRPSEDFVLTVMAHHRDGYRGWAWRWTHTGEPVYYPNYGSCVEVSAPGDGIYTTTVTGSLHEPACGYGACSGTSIAAPIVAGTVAILAGKSKALVANPSQRLTPTQIKWYITTYMRKYAIREPGIIPGYLDINGSVFHYYP
jgi:hypothetical protein